MVLGYLSSGELVMAGYRGISGVGIDIINDILLAQNAGDACI